MENFSANAQLDKGYDMYPVTNHHSDQRERKLINTQDDSIDLVDTLHCQAPSNTANLKKCTNISCTGSVMDRDGVGFSKDFNKSQIWKEAVDFLEAYYNSLSEKMSVNKKNRLDSVKLSIMNAGSYEHTVSELSFGAQLAWRNTPRCIGRIQWSNLQLFDGRRVKSTKEMFHLICNHIRYSTNNGVLRSAITVFSPIVEGHVICKVWNKQFISFAGYREQDGSVIGDPANVEFTDICTQLGWKGGRTYYDALPLVLQWGAEDPVYYTIPEDLILRVKIRHPSYPGLNALHLQWYALPAVSNMYLDCGGVIYPSCGFSGWYMSTEIMRDLCDTGRYNMLKEIGEAMGLDVSQPPVFWKDRAAVELNVAILHSFQQDGVTIVDHHSASDSFMRHLANETRIRGGCPADWVWINPPIGGSLTSVFHQEMLNYQLKPCYGYQKPPWREHTFKDLEDKKNKIHFKNIAKSIKLIVHLMSNVMAKRIPCTILYASETGTSEQFAYNLQKLFNQAFNCSVYSMADYDFTKLRFESLIFAVVSTFGNGEPPENGSLFVEMASKYIKEMINTDSVKAGSLHKHGNLNHDRPIYSVFGLGSSAYPNYCAFAKTVDDMMLKLGFDQLLPLATGDATKRQDVTFSSWSQQIFKICCQTYCIEMPKADHFKSLTQVTQHDPSICHLESLKDELSVSKGLTTLHHKEVLDCSVVSVDVLTQEGAGKEYIKLSLNHGWQARNNPGDHVAIFPCNSKENVDYICQRVVLSPKLTADTPVRLQQKQVLENGDERWIFMHRIPASSLRTALTHYLDINSPPSHSFIEQLVACNCINSDAEKKLVKHLASNAAVYNEYITMEQPSLRDFLQKFPSIIPPASLLLLDLPLLRARLYSISSSSSKSPTQIDITVSVLQYTTVAKDGTVIIHKGLCSNWMKTLEQNDTVRLYVRTSREFHMPADPESPMILIGPGSGVAPYRSFWQHKEYLKIIGTAVSPMLLFYGCWSEKEQIYKDEMDKMVSLGILEDYSVALSRSTSQPKIYVQDNIRNLSSKVHDYIVQRKAHVYVCGDVNMAVGVRKTLAEILDNATIQMEDNSRDGQLDSILLLKGEGRYHEDIYGSKSSTFNQP